MTQKNYKKHGFLFYFIMVLTAIIGLVLGLFLYLYNALGKINFINIRGIRNKIEESNNQDNNDKNEYEKIASQIKDGKFGQIKVNVDPNYPIEYVQRKDPKVENFLVFGIDSRGEEQARADSIMIITLNRNDNSLKLTSVLRDVEVNLNDKYGNRAKINAAYAYGGVGMLINTLNSNLDLDIQKFFMFDFWSSAELIDALGGIEIDIKEAELNATNDVIKYSAPLYKKKPEDLYLNKSGRQELNGIQAISWARVRAIDSDFGRTSRQRILAESLIAKFSKMPFLTQIDFGLEVLGHLETNVDKNSLIGVGMSGLQSLNNIQQYYVPQEGMYSINYNNWNMIYDPNQQIPALHKFIWSE